MSEKLIKYCGGCHCGVVRYEAFAPEVLDVFKCSCSICVKKQNNHTIVPKENFKLLQGKDCLTVYEFNTKKAKHTFCKICGVQSFYYPRSSPSGIGLVVHCLDNFDDLSLNWREFDGKNWEKQMEVSDIAKYSEI